MYIGDVNGKPIFADELEFRYKLALAMGDDAPYESAINSIQLMEAEKQFAEANNILVTSNEVVEYTNEQRDIVDNQAEDDLRNGIKEFISELGMSEDEYWTDYKFEENSRYLLHLKVLQYQRNNDIDDLELDNTPIRITEKAYLEKNIDSILE